MNEIIEMSNNAVDDNYTDFEKLQYEKNRHLKKLEKNNSYETKLQILTKIVETSPQTCLLRHLELSNLGLKSIPVDLIHLNYLTELNLSHNSLQKLPDCIYNGLPRLEVLDLSHNKIKVFDEPNCMLSLSVLNVNDNLLKIIPHWIWLYSCRLSELNISNNPIDMKNCEKIVKTTISVSRLKKLSISNCNLGNSNKGILRNIPYLIYLNIGNDTYGINKNYWDLDIFILQCRPQIQVLLLQNLCISNIPDEICELSSLKAVYLNTNIIYSIPEKFCLLHNLTICDFSNNQLMYLHENFLDLINLQELYLANNLLSKLPNVSHLKKLTVLDLYNNLLSCIDIDQLYYIEALDIENNFLIVTSEHYIKQKVKLRTKIEGLLRQDGFKEPECASSNNSDFHQDDLSNYSEVEEDETAEINLPADNQLQINDDNEEEEWETCLEDDFIPSFYPNINSFNIDTDPVCIKQNTNYSFYEYFVDAD